MNRRESGTWLVAPGWNSNLACGPCCDTRSQPVKWGYCRNPRGNEGGRAQPTPRPRSLKAQTVGRLKTAHLGEAVGPLV